LLVSKPHFLESVLFHNGHRQPRAGDVNAGVAFANDQRNNTDHRRCVQDGILNIVDAILGKWNLLNAFTAGTSDGGFP
jgi:hypothetical protein